MELMARLEREIHIVIKTLSHQKDKLND